MTGVTSKGKPAIEAERPGDDILSAIDQTFSDIADMEEQVEQLKARVAQLMAQAASRWRWRDETRGIIQWRK